MVGTACALELQRCGFAVTLVDMQQPGSATSHGNAGVMTRSSIVPLNNPALWQALPALLSNRSVGLRYRPGYLARNLGWALGFALSTGERRFQQTVRALDQLIGLSLVEHRRLLLESGQLHRLRSDGWIFLYRQLAQTEAMRLQLAAFAACGVRVAELDRAAIAALEPALRPVFARGLHVLDALSVDNPAAVVRGYAGLFGQRGGRLLQRSARGLRPDADGWTVQLDDGSPLQASQVVVALGPWSKDFLRGIGLKVPLAYERGYHMHYAAGAGAALTRPLYDAQGGYVLSPMQQGLRLSTGVELAALDAPPNHAQLELAEQAARQAIALGPRLDPQPWLGARPTLPDSRPMIGELPAPRRGLWAAFGHQHIGFSTGPGTARLLATLVCEQAPAIDAAAFAPARFLGR